MNPADADSGEMSELRTAAIVVWHHQRVGGSEAWAAMVKARTEQLRRVEMFRTELHRIIGERDDISFRVNGGCVEAAVEDLRFVALECNAPHTQGHLMLVTLLGRCPRCGVETRSEPVVTLAGLGKILENFEPASEHFCAPHQRIKTGK
jgi:hypothetical protein